MIRRCLRNLMKDDANPEYQGIVDIMKGNLGFIFTSGAFEPVLDVVKEFYKPAAAKAGVIAPSDCIIPKGPTGLDPAQTSFFQALNIATKINKGSIEIINDCQVIKEGTKVGSSEAALLSKLALKPFKYGLNIKYVWEGGVFSPDILKITEETLMGIWSTAVGNVAAISLATGIPTDASFPHIIVNAAKNIVAVSLAADFIDGEIV